MAYEVFFEEKGLVGYDLFIAEGIFPAVPSEVLGYDQMFEEGGE